MAGEETIKEHLQEGSKKILVVEDHEMVRRTLLGLFKGMGFDVAEAENGAVALDILRKGEFIPDVILTDFKMPEIGGVGLCKAIRDGELGDQLQQVLIILQTSNISDISTEDRVFLKDEGVEVIPKTGSPIKLIEERLRAG